MRMWRVLIVEDEPDIAALIKLSAERVSDVETEVLGRGDAALRRAVERPPDLIVLDLSLPVVDGVDVCRLLRAREETRRIPIIVVTARASEDDRVAGLELGADDYLTKPFSCRELTARIRAAIRRLDAAADTVPAAYRGEHLDVDFDGVQVRVDGDPVRLTRREFDLLRHLVQNRNRVVSRDRLLDKVWGLDGGIDTRSVDVHVARLRAKLGPAGRQIETYVGLGYAFSE